MTTDFQSGSPTNASRRSLAGWGAEPKQGLPDPRQPLTKSWCGSIYDRFCTHLSANNFAIMTAEDHWTYPEVDLASRYLAEFLIRSKGARSSVVAVYAMRSPALVISLLGIIRAGFAFTIVDPRYPHSRIAQHLELSPPIGLLNLTGAGSVPKPILGMIEAAGAGFVKDLPQAKRDLLSFGATSETTAYPTSVTVGPDDTMYVAFTSGTTGLPKGIVGSHGPVAHFFEWQQRTFDLGARDRVSVLSGLAHDPLMRDLLMPLWVGATICLPSEDCFAIPNKLYWWMCECDITVAHLTPGMGQLLLARAGRNARKPLDRLRYAFIGGDILRPNLVRSLKEAAPQVTIVNCYGTTETPQVVAYQAVDSHGHERADADGSEDSTIPIGRGIDECQLLVLDEELSLCKPGKVGEICVRTPHLAKEIRTAGGATGSRLVRNPYTAEANDLVYRTGDDGYYLPDGAVVYQGRRDRQVKVRGFRIELAEIDNVLAREADVLQHYVDVEGDEEHERRLILYVAWQPGWCGRARELREGLAAQLPHYMVPELIVTIERMPLTPNGKIDQIKLRAALSSQRGQSVAEALDPLGSMETTLLRIFRETLYAKDITLDEDIIAAGLNSLQAVEISCAIEDAFGCQLSIADIADARKIRLLAKRIATLRAQSAEHLASELGAAERREGSKARLPVDEPAEAIEASPPFGGGARPQGDKLGPQLIPKNENLFVGIKNRFLQLLARMAPDVWRVRLHRMRGVHIGENVSIGYDSILETSYPWLIYIGDHVNLGIRVTVIGHFRGMARVAKGAFSVEIKDDVFVGPGVIILPNVTIGEGAVVAAGSVVNDSVPPYTLVQGNPAKPKAKCGIALSKKTTYGEFVHNLRPINAGPPSEEIRSDQARRDPAL